MDILEEVAPGGLSNGFQLKIPHNFGYKKARGMSPTVALRSLATLAVAH